MIFIRVNKIDEKIGRVELIHYMPEMLSEKEKEEGFLFHEIPEPEKKEGKIPIAYYSYETNEVFYEYEGEPVTERERLSNLEIGNHENSEHIDICLMANVELFEMMLGITGYENDSNKNFKNGYEKMVDVYVSLIIKGKKDSEEVPTIIRPQVETMLDDLGVTR